MMADSIQFSLGNLCNNSRFNFLNILAEDDDISHSDFYNVENSDSPYNFSKFICNYFDESEFCTKYSQYSPNLSIMSLNIQSLNSKIGELKEFICNLSSHNCIPDIICLQEIWQIPDENLVQLSDYQPFIFKTRTRKQGGGVGFYIKKGLQFKVLLKSIFIEFIFESLFIEICDKDGKKTVIGSIYRSNSTLPNLTPSEQFTQFSEHLSSSLEEFSKNDKLDLILTGDLNIDILKYKNCNSAKNYVDTLFANGFLQIVTRPTRCTSTSASCLDHFITNSNQESYEVAIIIIRISDHFPNSSSGSEFGL